jgi:hypothetical protein
MTKKLFGPSFNFKLGFFVMSLIARNTQTRPHLVLKTWLGFGPGLAQVWPRFGPDLAQIWPRFGPGLAQVWPRFGPGLAQVWTSLAQVWTRFGHVS